MSKIKKFKPQKYSKAEVDHAKQLYLQHETTSSISRRTGIPRSTLRYYIKESWKEERDSDALDIVNKVIASTQVQLIETTTLTLDIINSSLTDIQEAQKTLKPHDLLSLSKVLENLNKIAIGELTNKNGRFSEIEDIDSQDGEVITLEEAKDLDPFKINKKEEKEGEND